MKTLSLKQPFAELILQGRKKIELRKWNTKFRGPFLVHASKTPDKEAMKAFGFSELPCGFIVGKANFVNVKHYENEQEHQKNSEEFYPAFKGGVCEFFGCSKCPRTKVRGLSSTLTSERQRTSSCFRILG